MSDTFGIVQRSLFFGLLIGGTALFLWMLRGFIMPILWAIVFAVVLFPLHRRLLRHVKSATLSALLTIIVLLVVVFGPVAGLGTLITNDAINLYQQFTSQDIDFIEQLQSYPVVVQALDVVGISAEELAARAVEAVRTAAVWIANEAFSIGAKTLNALVQTVLMLYILFFLLRDGERLGAFVYRILPLGNEREHLLFRRFTSTTRAMFRGTILVALVQGCIGGVLFSIAGVPNATLWGAVMAFLALIPAVGPALVLIPAGIFMIATGNIWQGVVLLVGSGVVSVIDNILRPILAGRGADMPEALILLAVLGGLATFGIAGVILGPVVAALFLAIWSLFEKEYGKDLETRG